MAYNFTTMQFEWDPKKDLANQKKHGIGFEEVKELFLSDDDYLERFDEAHSFVEERFIAIGPIRRGIVVVVYCERVDDSLRIISARWATESEKDLYRRYMEQ